MDALPPPDGLLPRGGQAELHERIMAETRRAAWLNTARHAVLTLGGWTFGICATAVACYALHEMHNRPVLPPEVHVALVYPDRQTPAVVRDKLPAAERQIVLEKSLLDYVRCREEYIWAALRRCYRHVSVMSTPEVRDAYQKRVNDQQDPEAPQVKYGAGPNAGSARIVGEIAVYADARQPNQLSFAYLLVEERPGKPAVQRRRITRLVWDDARGIPYNLQREFTPLNVQVAWYATDPDQTPAARAAAPVPAQEEP